MSEGGKGRFDEGFATYEQRHAATRGSVLRAMLDSNYPLEERDSVMALHHINMGTPRPESRNVYRYPQNNRKNTATYNAYKQIYPKTWVHRSVLLTTPKVKVS